MNPMKHIAAYCLIFILLSSVLSCQDQIVPQDVVQESGICLTLSSSSLSTKADEMDGVEALNENRIHTIHYFLYPEDPEDASADNTEKQPSHWGVLTDVDAQGQKKFMLNISEDEMNNVLFPRPYDECEVYAIVNLPEGITIEDATDKRLSNLKQIALEADFVSKEVQDLFVMEGMGKVKLLSRASVLAAEGEIPVERVASKLTVNIAVDKEVTYDTKIWKSLPEEMVVYFYNGVNNAVLSGDPTAVDPEYFDPQPSRTFTQAGSVWTCSPLYSYPLMWNVGAEEEPYLKIILPWMNESTSVGGQGFIKQYTYYKVILGGESMVRNTWYDMTVHLSVLGNFDDFEDNDVEITEMTYKVVDWSSGLSIDTEILEARYLVVENTSYVLNNQETLRIPVSSSHDCEIVDFGTLSNENEATVTRPDYSSRNLSTQNVDWDQDWSLQFITNEIEGSYVEFRHQMNYDLNSDDIDFAPYTIWFRVRHKDDPDQYYRDVMIVQNPSMMIQSKPNSDQTTGDGNYGYTFVNGDAQSASGMDDSFSDTNSNPNMYVIEVNSFDSASDYIIADPRSVEIDNLGQTWAENAVSVEGARRRINYYYPTIDDISSENLVAPKFRIASSYGKWSGGTYSEAQQRCASYQEDGYPAGRWRIPTKAEIEFIITLSTKDIIPTLFTASDEEEYAYWCSTGGIYPRTDGTIDYVYQDTRFEHSVRCVYDEWYWENSSAPTVDNDVFTWGDAAR